MWSSSRMSCNIRKRGTSYSLVRSPYRFQTFLGISLPEKLGKSHRPQNKTPIRGASPGVSDEVWDKNAICGRRWDVATQERKVCNMEIIIAMFVVKVSDRPCRLTGANPSRKQKCCSPSCLWYQAQGDTSDRDNYQSLAGLLMDKTSSMYLYLKLNWDVNRFLQAESKDCMNLKLIVFIFVECLCF